LTLASQTVLVIHDFDSASAFVRPLPFLGMNDIVNSLRIWGSFFASSGLITATLLNVLFSRHLPRNQSF
jgi:hypothetical protein